MKNIVVIIREEYSTEAFSSRVDVTTNVMIVDDKDVSTVMAMECDEGRRRVIIGNIIPMDLALEDEGFELYGEDREYGHTE